VKSKRTLRIVSIIALLSLLAGMFPAAPSLAKGNSNWASESIDIHTWQSTTSDLQSPAFNPQNGCYATDLDCDHDVDEADVQLVADHWNCASGEPCYAAAYDLDGNGVVDAFDLAWVANDYDTTSPVVTIVSPTEGQVVGTSGVLVIGTTDDIHAVVSVTVNGAAATLNGNTFTANVSLASGNQVLNIVAEDELGQKGLASRVVGVDGDGPAIQIRAPKPRQAVYTLTPAIDIGYTDFYTGVDTSSLSVLLVDESGMPTDVTGDLTVTADSASGVLSNPLAGDASYTLTVSLADDYGNVGSAHATFYVPPDPASITPPGEPEGAGWVSGIVYDSSTCNEHLTTCDGLPGASVTLAISGGVAITGTIVTGPAGFFAFPLAETGHYWLRVEKEGYTYGQRAADVVRERSTATNEIYLTPIDPAVTYCDSSGCTHASSDGILQVEIPPGVIAPGEVVTTTATNYEHVEFLPSGDLPPGTWETYAFNLGGDSEITFTQPITVRQLNYRGFAPGSEIPLGYWNQRTMEWEHEGFAIVDPSGEWAEMEVRHFSNYDCNFPLSPSGIAPKATPLPPEQKPCAAKSEGILTYPESKCTFKKDAAERVYVGSGRMVQEHTLPPTNVVGEDRSPTLLYSTNRAEPNAVIDVGLSLDVDPGTELGDYVGWELYIEGQRTDSFSFSRTADSGEMGRYRYYWDGRDGQGELLPPGVYEYAVKLSLPYQAQYCGTNRFGGLPDCVNRPTGIFVEAIEDTWAQGTVKLEAEPNSPLGEGWALGGMQHLYEDESGQLLIVDGEHTDEFYFPQKDLLSAAEDSLSTLSEMASLPENSPAIEGSPLQISVSESLAPLPSLERVPLPITDTPVYQRISAEPSEVETTATAPVPVPEPEAPTVESFGPYSEIRMPQGTLVCGDITTNTVWAIAVGTYVVTCDVQVLADVTLTVEPGVVVQFEHTDDDLIVAGTLLATGTEEALIRFGPETGATAGSWGRVAFLSGSAGLLDYTILEYGGSNDGALYLASDAIEVVHSVVQYSADSGIVVVSASPLISGSEILSNTGNHVGGLWNYSGNPSIQYNTFQGNSASCQGDLWGTFSGGGIYNDSGNPIIENNLVQSNSASCGSWDFSAASGGGIYNGSGDPVIQNNIFQNNYAYANSQWMAEASGGGIYNSSGDPTIQNNTFRSNTSANSGGGIYNGSGNPAIQNNTFLYNSARSGGGIYSSSGSPPILNNVYYGNSSTYGGGGLSYGGNPTIHNNIIISNTAPNGGGIYQITSVSGLDIGYNNVWNNNGGDYYGTAPSPHDISVDPLFVDAQGSDFHLLPASPCIDAGHPESYPEIDFDSEPRPMGRGPDIGIDEHRSLRIHKTSLLDEVELGQVITFNVLLGNMEAWSVTNVVMTDTFSNDLAFSSYQADDFTCVHDGSPWGGTLVCALDSGSLLPDETRSLTLTMEMTDTLLNPKPVVNAITATAEVSGTQRIARDQASTWVSWCAVRLNDEPEGSDLQATISASTSPTDVVRVSGRCLVHDVNLDRTLTLQGGWSRDWSIQDTATYSTTLDAQGLDRVLSVSGSVSPTIEGFVIHNGWTNSGGGIYNSYGNPTIQNNIFQSNSANYGGGIYNSSGNPIIQNNTFQDNSAYYGGGLYTFGSPTIQNNIFQDNSANYYGGGIDNGSGNPTVQNNIFQDNSANYYGGGIYNGSGNPTVQNNTFQGNSAHDSGGGICNWSGSPTILYNSVQGNSANDSGGGFYNSSGSPSIRNNILANNSASDCGGICSQGGFPGPTSDYNDVWNNSGGDYYGVTPGPHAISVDPLFVDAPAGDLHLTSGSPCIDAGDPDDFPETDFEGDSRPLGLVSDIGADEVRTLGMFKTAPGNVAPGEVFTYNLQVLNLETVTATGVLVTDQMPTEVAYLGYQGSGLSCTHDGALWGGRLTCAPDGGSLYPGEIRLLTVTVMATDTMPAPLQVQNVVTATAEAGEDDLVARNQASTWVSWCAVRLNDEPEGSDLQATISASTSPTDVVRVSGRCLVHDVNLDRTLTLQGGWSRDFAVRNTALYITTLDAQRLGRVLSVSGSVSPTIEGFVITGGRWQSPADGGGVYISSGNPTIQNNTFQDNSANYGGGLYNSSGNPIIQNNTFQDNLANGGSGGGIANSSGNPIIQNNTFQGNSANYGGAIAHSFGSPIIQNNTFQDNSASSNGGGIYNSFGSPMIRNNILASNSANDGGGIYSAGGSPGPAVDFNDVWNNSGGDYYGVIPGSHDISVDPLFAGAPASDFHLLSESPCIDAGDPDNYPPTDFEGDPRPLGDAPDIGADETLASYAYAESHTAIDYSHLQYDFETRTYTRIYADGTEVHFNSDGTHDYTLDRQGNRTAYTYNPDGTLASIAFIPTDTVTGTVSTLSRTAEATHVWAFSYTSGKLSSITDPAERVIAFEVDKHDHLTKITSFDGASREFTYDSRGLMTQVKEAEGAITTYKYDGYGRVKEVVKPQRTVFNPVTGMLEIGQEVHTFTNTDTSYALINSSPTGDPDNPAAAVLRSFELVDRVDDGSGAWYGYTNKWGSWTERTDALGRTWLYERDERDNITRETRPDGSCTDYTYDGHGNMLSESWMTAAQCADPDPQSEHEWTYTYEQSAPYLRNVKTATDPMGNTTMYYYDYELGVGSRGDLVKVVYPAVEDENGSMVNPTITYTYNARGEIETATDERGTVTKYIYTQGTPDEGSTGSNPLFLPGVSPKPGLLTQRIVDYGGLDITTIYKGFTRRGVPTIVIGPDDRHQGRETHYTYDAYGCILSETDALGIVNTYEYDKHGNMVRQVRDYTDGSAGRNIITEFTYDSDDHLLSQRTAADGLVFKLTNTYDRSGNLTTQADSTGNTSMFSYDEEDQLVAMTDPLGRTTQYTYNDNGDLTSSTAPDGTITRYVYDEFGRQVQEIVDEGGLNLTTNYTYDLNDNLLSVTAPEGNTTCYTYDALNRRTGEIQDCGGGDLTITYVHDVGGNLARTTNPRGVATEHEYDAVGRLLRLILDAGGLDLETAHTYDDFGNLTSTTDPRGTVTTYEYDDVNQLTQACEDATGLNLCTIYTYDRLGNLATTTAPIGVTTLTEYNAFDLLVREVRDQGGLNVETQYQYDNNLNLITLTDPRSNDTRYNYDAAYQLVAETDPLGHTTTQTYTAKGELNAVTAPDGDVTRYVYDAAGGLIHEIADDGDMNLTTAYTYDGNGNLATTTDPEGLVTCYAYDALDRLVGETQDCAGLDLTTSYAFDGNGNLTSITDERGIVTQNSYDALDRLISTRRDATGLNLETTYTYDANGNLTSTTDERGVVTAYTYDDLNRLTQTCQDTAGQNLCTSTTYDEVSNLLTVTDPSGVVARMDYNALNQIIRYTENDGGLDAETLYAYDKNLNLTAITDANGNTTSYQYDVRNQQTRITYADSTTARFTYNPDGTLASRTDQAGKKTNFAYDGADRLQSKSYPDGSSQALAYDNVGRLVNAQQTMSGHTTQSSYAYNPLGDVTSSAQTVDGHNWTTTYAYDYPAGTKTISYPSGTQVVRSTDVLRRLSQVQRGGAPVASYAYDDASGTVTLSQANGVNTLVETDPLRRVTRVSSSVADYRYGYNAASVRTYMQRWHEAGHPADVYQYDDLYQLTQVWYGADATNPGDITDYDRLQWYDLDTVGNRLEVQNDGASQIYLPNNGQKLTNPMNHYTKVGGTSFSYDAKGNLLNDGANTYTYDYENRQIGMSGPGGNAEYVYGAEGRRVAKFVDGVATYYVYDTRYQVIEERAAGDQLLVRYTYGSGIDEPLTMERNGNMYHYQWDALGSVTEVTDATGNLVERYTYDVYGAPSFYDGADNPLSGSAIGNPYLFASRRYDSESRNYYYRARIYAPSIGRFLQMDPLGYVNGMNLYAYVGSRPADLVDPSGQLAPIPGCQLDRYFQEHLKGYRKYLARTAARRAQQRYRNMDTYKDAMGDYQTQQAKEAKERAKDRYEDMKAYEKAMWDRGARQARAGAIALYDTTEYQKAMFMQDVMRVYGPLWQEVKENLPSAEAVKAVVSAMMADDPFVLAWEAVEASFGIAADVQANKSIDVGDPSDASWMGIGFFQRYVLGTGKAIQGHILDQATAWASKQSQMVWHGVKGAQLRLAGLEKKLAAQDLLALKSFDWGITGIRFAQAYEQGTWKDFLFQKAIWEAKSLLIKGAAKSLVGGGVGWANLTFDVSYAIGNRISNAHTDVSTGYGEDTVADWIAAPFVEYAVSGFRETFSGGWRDFINRWRR
jgi:RHS repeat-associated protein/uncharacterized repeat protein (TIGR01451 family)